MKEAVKAANAGGDPQAAVLGAVSVIFWSLIIVVSFKYAILILRADNRGEGGIFSLFALVRRHGRWAVFLAIVGGAALLADGMITPPISVISAVEGLKNLPGMQGISDWDIVGIGIGIISILFFFQQFGSSSIGKAFGPIMTIWFLMLGMFGIGLGLGQLMQSLTLAAQNAVKPYYMGVATSAATFFRQIGGTMGTAVLLSVLFTVMPTNIQNSMSDEEELSSALDAALRHPIARTIHHHQLGS